MTSQMRTCGQQQQQGGGGGSSHSSRLEAGVWTAVAACSTERGLVCMCAGLCAVTAVCCAGTAAAAACQAATHRSIRVAGSQLVAAAWAQGDLRDLCCCLGAGAAAGQLWRERSHLQDSNDTRNSLVACDRSTAGHRSGQVLSGGSCLCQVRHATAAAAAAAVATGVGCSGHCCGAWACGKVLG